MLETKESEDPCTSSNPSRNEPERLMVLLFSSRDMELFRKRLSVYGSYCPSALERLWVLSMVGLDRLIWVTAVGLASWEKLNLVPEGEVTLEPEEKGELAAVSCRPPAEWDRNHSFVSSCVRSWEVGVYLSPFLGKVFLSRCGSLQES